MIRILPRCLVERPTNAQRFSRNMGLFAMSHLYFSGTHVYAFPSVRRVSSIKHVLYVSLYQPIMWRHGTQCIIFNMRTSYHLRKTRACVFDPVPLSCHMSSSLSRLWHVIIYSCCVSFSVSSLPPHPPLMACIYTNVPYFKHYVLACFASFLHMLAPLRVICIFLAVNHLFAALCVDLDCK